MLLSILSVTDNTAVHVGSGFVTNKKGLFITAGHVIYNYSNQLDKLRIAFPEFGTHCKLYKFRVLYKEYVDPRYVKGNALKKIRPNHQDLAICRVMSYKKICREMSIEITQFKIITRRPGNDDILTVKGFYRSGNVEIREGFVDLSQIGQEDTPFEIKHRLFAIVSGEDNDYLNDPNILGPKKKFNNCLTLNLSSQPGVSGGPVFNNENKVVGCYLGGKPVLHYCNILCAKYIRKRYKLIDDRWNKDQ